MLEKSDLVSEPGKKSLGIIIFGWVEILIGGLGTIGFTLCLFTVFSDFVHPVGVFLAIIPSYFLSLSPLFLLGGIGVVRFKPWGRKINLIVIPILSLLLVLLPYTEHFFRTLPFNFVFEVVKPFTPVAIPFVLFLILLVVWFFNRPKVKQQFLMKENKGIAK